jgi:hypothetical protein
VALAELQQVAVGVLDEGDRDAELLIQLRRGDRRGDRRGAGSDSAGEQRLDVVGEDATFQMPDGATGALGTVRRASISREPSSGLATITSRTSGVSMRATTSSPSTSV